MQLIDAMEFENEDQRKDPEVIIEKVKEYCIGECNETYERYCSTVGTKSQMNQLILMSPHYEN